MTHRKRLTREAEQLRKTERNGRGDEMIYLVPLPDNICEWNAFIRGPPDSPYEGRVFEMSISVGAQYPLVPPTIIFRSKVFHPNVNYDTGEICLDILKKNWSPAWSLEGACRAIIALLADPDVDSPWNCDAGHMIRAGDMVAFNSMAKCLSAE